MLRQCETAREDNVPHCLLISSAQDAIFAAGLHLENCPEMPRLHYHYRPPDLAEPREDLVDDNNWSPKLRIIVNIAVYFRPKIVPRPSLRTLISADRRAMPPGPLFTCGEASRSISDAFLLALITSS